LIPWRGFSGRPALQVSSASRESSYRDDEEAAIAEDVEADPDVSPEIRIDARVHREHGADNHPDHE
jgi:hypothetical protein